MTMETTYDALIDRAMADFRTRMRVELAKLKAPIRAEAFEEASRELRSIEGAPEAVAAYKRAAELLRAMAARERVL